MDKAGADAYIYAKASGNLGKSFTGSRASILFEQKNLTDLWTLLFNSTVPMVPEVMLANQIEEEAFKKFLSQYIEFISMYDKPDSVLLDQLCIYEAENLKEVAAALCTGESALPNLKDLGSYSNLNFKAWPDIAAITKKSNFSWYNKVPDIHEQQKMEFKLDMQVIRHLWNSVQSVKDESAEAIKNLFMNEFVMRNVIWALRLRIYFKMSNENIIPLLIYVTEKPNKADPVAGPALKVLDMPLDEPEVWENWKYRDLVNPHIPGEIWQIDPSWMERKNKAKLNKMAQRIFHQYPMTTGSLIGWFKIKNYELNCIRTAVESLRLNINADEAMSAIGISSEGGING